MERCTDVGMMGLSFLVQEFLSVYPGEIKCNLQKEFCKNCIDIFVFLGEKIGGLGRRNEEQ
jgi:hypothetical protein